MASIHQMVSFNWLAILARAWNNLRYAGIDLDWWIDFVFNKLDSIRPQTRALIRVLDARGFAKDAYDFASYDGERTLHESFKRALWLLPNVNSILLDEHADLNPGALISASDKTTLTSTTASQPSLLSITGCPYQLPNTLFSSRTLEHLVYLDISFVPGSILPLIQPALLPELRILKIRGREIDDYTFAGLVGVYRRRLWSLDIADNKISDAVLDTFRNKCFPVTQLRSEAQFRVEGKVVLGEHGTVEHGSFMFLEESESSGQYNHPERYFVDAPMYMAQPDQGPQEYESFRASGMSSPHKDTADAASTILSEGVRDENFRSSRGITHLQLSNNMISAVGLEKLIRISNGQLEELTCDSLPFLPLPTGYSTVWPKGSSLQGIVGAGHVFRPVFSSNLRVLRIHHSFVTNILTLNLEGLSTLSRLYISENHILPRVEQLYHQSFIPDMNPRISSLTLTHVPRRSSGPLIRKLVTFLRLLSIQERSIQSVGEDMSSWRSPGMLKGLRHLRLEIEPDPLQDGFSALDDLDAEELLNTGDRGFSFFEDERVERVQPAAKKSTPSDKENSSVAGDADHDASQSVRDDQEFVTFTGQWNGSSFSIPVWIGKSPASCSTMKQYRKLVVQNKCRDGVGPVNPAQVKAGVPEKAYIFHTAWRLAIMPDTLTPPSTASLSEMKDVLDDLRAYRLSGRARYEDMKKRSHASETVALGEPHFFWTGRLEVSREDPAARTRPSQYWR